MQTVVDGKASIVREPELHDATLLGIAFNSDVLYVRFRLPLNGVVEVCLNGVRGLVVESMFEGNIVFEMRINPIANVQSGDIQKVLHLSGTDARDRDRIEAIRAQTLVLVEIDPSFGAEITALCTEVTWRPID